MTFKTRKRKEISSFEVLDGSLLRAEDFSYSLDALYGGLGVCKLQFLIKYFFSAVNFFFNFWSSKPCTWIRIRIHIGIRMDLKCCSHIRIRIKNNSDPKHWLKVIRC